MSQRKGGVIQLQVNGVLYDCKGAFDYGLGTGKRESIIGSDRPHGFKETPQAPFIEGKITDRATLDLKTLFDTTDATVTLTLANGKVIVLGGAFYAGDGKANSEEGEVEVRFEGDSCEEV